MATAPTMSRLQAVLLAFAASSLSCLGTAWYLRPEPPPPGPRHGEAARLAALLARFEAVLDAHAAPARADEAIAATPVREPVDVAPEGEFTHLVERLEALAARTAAPPPRALPRDKPVDHRALATLHDLARADREAANRSTMLLTAEEVAARFGFPDEVGGASGGGVFWNYHHRGPTGERDGGTLFVFLDGRVAWHEISTPDH